MLTNVGTLKEVLHEDLRQSKTPPKVLCEEMGMALSTLYNCCNPQVTDCHLKLKELVYFSQRTGGRHAIAFLNRCLNQVSIPLEELSKDPENIESMVVANIGIFGEVLADYRAALADKAVTLDEAKHLEKGINTLIDKLVKTRESVNLAALNDSVTA